MTPTDPRPVTDRTCRVLLCGRPTMSARKRKAVPARLYSNHLRPAPESDVRCDPEVNGYSDHANGSGNGDERAAPDVGWRHVTGDVMESIRSVIGSAPTVEDKQQRLNAMMHQLQVIRDQLQQVRFCVLELPLWNRSKPHNEHQKLDHRPIISSDIY